MQLTVLAVDDNVVNLKVISALIRKVGFDLVTASNGQEAVEVFRQKRPDIVLMDVMMPEMDGIEATRIIKSEKTERWVPIVFLSALSSDEDLVGGLAAGGDDYLFKPVNSAVLTAKLKTLARLLIGFREREAETQLAMDILSRQLARAIVPGEPIDYWQTPAAGISGDVVASAKSPDGTLFILLADATGHGLSASICTMPVLSLFYELVEWGLALPAIIQRINNQLNRFVPATHFVALAALAIEPETGFFDVWSGGIPDILLVDADGCIRTRIPSRHMAVGICEMENEDMTVDRHELGAGQQILMMSDGLSEAVNLTGECLGEARLEGLLRGTHPESRMAAIKTGFAEFMGKAIPHDDVTVICVGPNQNCNSERPVRPARLA
jgi:CheY-like chemotaxis protein